MTQNSNIPFKDLSLESTFTTYEMKFKALADKKRLQIMNILTQRGEMCVCDLAPLMDMTQSKLSYHLKILFEAKILLKETRGTWSYYSLNHAEINHLLSEELCCLFRSDNSETKPIA
ncbi:ArsR/SmtB family transcription factor [Bacillus weihaiensis]|uniref:Transcriptional regulator n=1 Tax=Bacillus weihaiensis TaxID=1547283 RepID=A0A1L3MUW0_9BACI|nr:metalloregulator ArsR/SmtB family transcription factor [Bacillus weihaiensis]APH06118.1 transcriptional regulator [Bacillus weihaiensis]